MTADLDSLRGLATAERARLERFAALFDRLDASQYMSLAETIVTPEAEAAIEQAQALAGRSGPRRDALRSAIGAFTNAATVAYARRMSLPDTIFLFQSLPDRAEDRTRFLQSVERTVVALVLWDQLDDDERVALLGLWAPLVEPLVDG